MERREIHGEGKRQRLRDTEVEQANPRVQKTSWAPAPWGFILPCPVLRLRTGPPTPVGEPSSFLGKSHSRTSRQAFATKPHHVTSKASYTPSAKKLTLGIATGISDFNHTSQNPTALVQKSEKERQLFQSACESTLSFITATFVWGAMHSGMN